jgi:hypothetical protein
MRKILVLLVVLGLLGVAGDRVARKFATDEAEKRLATHGLATPTVDVAGFPFLTQLLARRFDDVRVSTPSLRIGSGRAEQLRLRRDVSVLGRTFAVTARGRVEPQGNRLRVVPTSFERAGGAAIDDQLAQVLAGRFSLDYQIRGLPSGVHVQRIAPAQNGFVVDVSGRDVTLTED